MKKLLYDIAPFYLSEKSINILHTKKMVGTAVCAPESCITEALKEILTLFYNRFSGIVFIRADEETILKTANYLKTDYDYKQMKPSGFLSYKLPELSFLLSSENLSDILRERCVILNKSGDADELECIIKEQYVQEVLDVFIKYFKADKK